MERTVVRDYVGEHIWREAHHDENGDLHGVKKLWIDNGYYIKKNKETKPYRLLFFILYMKSERQAELKFNAPMIEDVPKQQNFFNKKQWKKICSRE